MPTVQHNGPLPLHAEVRDVYHVSEHETRRGRAKRGPLIDRGANGGILGNDARVFRKSLPPREVDVTGIDNHEMNSLAIVDPSAKVITQRGLSLIHI